MSVKKIKQSRIGNKDARNAPRVKNCACVKHFGAKWCVAQYDAEHDCMIYVGIPCVYCGKKITITEGEYNCCDECFAIECEMWDHPWYNETVVTDVFDNNTSPMHQSYNMMCDIIIGEQILDEMGLL